MSNKLREIFFPTEEEIKAHEKWFQELHNQAVEDRETVKLVLTRDPVLYRREPFKGFLGDCCSCSHYIDGGGMTEGGHCTLHGIGCGWGFTCKDNDGKWAIKIKEK